MRLLFTCGDAALLTVGELLTKFYGTVGEKTHSEPEQLRGSFTNSETGSNHIGWSKHKTPT